MAARSGASAYLLAAPLAVPLVVVFVLVTGTPCHAAPAPAAAAGDDAGAVDLLSRATKVATQAAYRGVQRMHAWVGGSECVQTLRVRNVPGQGTYVVAGRGARAVGGERPHTGTAGPRLDLLTANYTVLRAGIAKVAGRWADIVEARRSTGVIARYWLDRRTGLMLRREVFDETGRLARRTAFVDIRFEPTAPHTRQPARAAPSVSLGRRVSLHSLRDLRADGWTVPRKLDDVQSLYDVHTSGNGTNKSLHLSYSDGVSAVSVFEQRGHLDESHLTGWHHAQVGGRTVYVRDTVPRQLSWAGPGTVFTVVADAPDRAVADTVRILPGAERRPGAWSRIVRGLSRIVSWCNPF